MYTNVIKWIMNYYHKNIYYLQVQWRFTRMIPGLKEVPNEIRLKLEIWGRAQHEAARRPRYDLKYILGSCNGV